MLKKRNKKIKENITSVIFWNLTMYLFKSLILLNLSLNEIAINLSSVKIRKFAKKNNKKMSKRNQQRAYIINSNLSNSQEHVIYVVAKSKSNVSFKNLDYCFFFYKKQVNIYLKEKSSTTRYWLSRNEW